MQKPSSKKISPRSTCAFVLAAFLLSFFQLAQAQQPTKIPRIGWLTGGFLSSNPARVEAFR